MILKGKEISNKILENVKTEYDKLLIKKNRKACLAVILVGDNEASKLYVKLKEKTCEKLNILSKTIILPENTDKKTLKNTILSLNNDKSVDAILLQLPLPSHLKSTDFFKYINKDKDVDCFNPFNIGNISINKSNIIPCTVNAVISLLKETKVKIKSKDILIIGRSNIIGKPLCNLLINLSATVQIAHSKTKNLKEKIEKSDIIISCVGKPHFIKNDINFKKNTILIDVGTNKINNKIVGDIDFENIIKNKNISYITPVPGGVGPLTISYLIKNTIYLYSKRKY